MTVQAGHDSDSDFSLRQELRWGDFTAARPRLIPPLAGDFRVHGNTRRARAWALANHYLLVQDIPCCAHGLYLMSWCPGRPGCGPGFDHTDIWVDADVPWRPFILTSPHAREVPAGMAAYADAHGLKISVNAGLGKRDDGDVDDEQWLDWKQYPACNDGWYGRSSLPIRLTAGDAFSGPWPLGTAAAALLQAYPVHWPGDDQSLLSSLECIRELETAHPDLDTAARAQLARNMLPGFRLDMARAAPERTAPHYYQRL